MISKKKKKEIEALSFVHDILKQYSFTFVERTPDEWDREENNYMI